MSIDLNLKLTRPVEIDPLLPQISTFLRVILGQANIPNISAVGYDYNNEMFVPLKSSVIDLSSDTIFFKVDIDDEPEIANVGVIQIDQPELSDEEQGFFVYVNSGSQRTPLEFALMAAVAAAIGYHLDTPVIDDRPFFTDIESQSANEFVNAIKVKALFDDYRMAAQSFYESLPLREKNKEGSADNVRL